MTAALPRRRTGRPGRVRRTWARHPRVGLAVEAFLAATLAWLAAQACLAEFVDGVRRARATTADDLFVAGDVVHTVRSSPAALRPRETAG